MTAPIRILVLNERDMEHPKAGGAEIHVERLFARVAARGHPVVHYSTGFRRVAHAADQPPFFPGTPVRAPRRSVRHGIEIERFGPLAAYYAGMPWRVARACRRGEFDLVVECLNKIPFYSPLYAGIPVLALCHHLFGEVAFDQVAWPIAAAVLGAERGIPRAYRDTDFLAISPSTRDDLLARGIAASRIGISLPGIDRPALTVDPTTLRPARIA